MACVLTADVHVVRVTSLSSRQSTACERVLGVEEPTENRILTETPTAWSRSGGGAADNAILQGSLSRYTLQMVYETVYFKRDLAHSTSYVLYTTTRRTV